MSFLSDIKAFEKKALLQASNNSNKIILDFGVKAVELGPKKPFAQFSSGHLNNNWKASVNTPDTSTSNSADMAGSASIASLKAVLSVLPFYGKDSTVYFTNSVSYAYRVEKLGWPAGEGDNGWHWSGRISPYAMVSHSINYILGKYQ